MLTKRGLAKILKRLLKALDDSKSDDYKTGYYDAVADIAAAAIDA